VNRNAAAPMILSPLSTARASAGIMLKNSLTSQKGELRWSPREGTHMLGGARSWRRSVESVVEQGPFTGLAHSRQLDLRLVCSRLRQTK
jgi:hypothetical protein